MNRQFLERAGWETFSWNNGAIIDLWITIDERYGFDKSLVVRYWNESDSNFMVYLRTPGALISLPTIRHLNDAETLYRLLTRKEDDEQGAITGLSDP